MGIFDKLLGSEAPPDTGEGLQDILADTDIEAIQRATLPKQMFFRETSKTAIAKWATKYAEAPDMQEAWQRSGQYITQMKAIFKEEGVPEELVYLGLTESYWNTTTTPGSPDLFQMTDDAMARRYGLIIDDHIDERRAPLKVAKAVALYLADMFNQVGTWKPQVDPAYRWGWAILCYNMNPQTVAQKYREHRGNLEAFLETTDNEIAKNYLFKLYGVKRTIDTSYTDLEQEPSLRFDQVTIIYPKKPPREHTMKTGETIYELVGGNNYLEEQVLEMNGIEDPTRIKPGDKIIIPLKSDYTLNYPTILQELGLFSDRETRQELVRLNNHLTNEILGGQYPLPETTLYLPTGKGAEFYSTFGNKLIENPEQEAEDRHCELRDRLGI